METYIILILAVAHVFGVIGTWITDSRGKNFAVGYAAGFILGPIGILVLKHFFLTKKA